MKAFIFFLLLSFAITALATKTRWFELNEDYSFDRYTKEFGKRYTANEYVMRKGIFTAKLAEILQHNSNPAHSYKKGVNQLTDLTPSEFRRRLGINKGMLYKTKVQSEFVMTAEEEATLLAGLPDSVDWRDKGVVTPVKDQGDCGSCWSFGAAETLESHWAIVNGQLDELSEQQILDCTANPLECGGTGGCGGATVELAYDHLLQVGGLASEWTYPYMSYPNQNFNCTLNTGRSAPPQAIINNYTVLPSNVYAPLLASVATVGPIAITVDASAWADYETGVFNGCNQTNPDLNHAVQLVGYGTDAQNGDYWLVRNSWSPFWGDDGYLKIARTSSVQCGVDIHPLDGTGCISGPQNVTVCGTCGILYDTSYPQVVQKS